MARNLLSFLIGIVLFAFILRRVGLENIFQTVKLLSFGKGLIIFFTFLMGTVISSWRWKLILSSQNRNISLKKLFIAKVAGFSINYITPCIYTGGELARAYVLKKENEISLTDGLTSIFIDHLLDLMAGILFFILSLFFLLFHFKIPAHIIHLLLLVILGGLIFLFYFYLGVKKGKNPFTEIIKFLKLDRIKLIKNYEENIKRAERGIIVFFKEKKETFFAAFFLTIITLILSLVQFWLILYFLNYKFSAGEIILIRLLVALAGLLPIPGALGTLETSGALAFIILGLNANIGITFILIIRTFNLMFVGAGLIFLSHFGIKFTEVFIDKKLLTRKNNAPIV